VATTTDLETVAVLGDGIAARFRPAAGERVLWIHGYSMDSSVWDELWRFLPEWEHIGIDLPGHGASRAIRSGEDLRAVALRLGGLGLERGVRHIVALSFGTIVAVQIAIEYPDAFASLCLGAPALAGGPEDAAAAARYTELGRLYREGGTGAELATLWMRSPPDIFKGVDRHPALRQRLADVIGRHRWQELVDGSMRLLITPPQELDQLRSIQSATLVVLGNEELPAFRRCAELILAAIAASKRVELPAAGHLCLLEQPQQAARVLAAHLRRCERPLP
jgi:pimeloyl-ACP methyl ester carboxylesterase